MPDALAHKGMIEKEEKRRQRQGDKYESLTERKMRGGKEGIKKEAT